MEKLTREKGEDERVSTKGITRGEQWHIHGREGTAKLHALGERTKYAEELEDGGGAPHSQDRPRLKERPGSAKAESYGNSKGWW